MGEAKPIRPGPREARASLRAVWVADAQWGVIGHRQLRDCGVSSSTMSRWRANGRLHLLLPHVFALGHRSVPVEGWLTAAIIYAGPSAVLSHGTAAWWWGLIPNEPTRIEVST